MAGKGWIGLLRPQPCRRQILGFPPGRQAFQFVRRLPRRRIAVVEGITDAGLRRENHPPRQTVQRYILQRQGRIIAVFHRQPIVAVTAFRVGYFPAAVTEPGRTVVIDRRRIQLVPAVAVSTALNLGVPVEVGGRRMERQAAGRDAGSVQVQGYYRGPGVGILDPADYCRPVGNFLLLPFPNPGYGGSGDVQRLGAAVDYADAQVAGGAFRVADAGMAGGEIPFCHGKGKDFRALLQNSPRGGVIPPGLYYRFPPESSGIGKDFHFIMPDAARAQVGDKTGVLAGQVAQSRGFAPAPFPVPPGRPQSATGKELPSRHPG